MIYSGGTNTIFVSNSGQDNDGKVEAQKKRNQSIIDKIEQWQDYEYVKPLICRKTGKKLVPKIHKKSGKVCLRCPESNYIQWSIPKIVLDTKLIVFEHARKPKPKKTNRKRRRNKNSNENS